MGIGKFVSLVQEIGVLGSFCYGLHRVLHRSGLGRVCFYGFYAQPLETSIVIRGYQCAFLSDPARLSSLLGLPQNTIERRVQEGAQCIAAYHQEKLVASLWNAKPGFEEDEVAARFEWMPEHLACWDFGVHVVPERRHGRAFAALWTGSMHLLQDQGYRWSLSRISLYNRASILSHERMGAIILGRAAFFVLGPLQLMLSSHHPWANICLGQRGRPVFHFKLPVKGR